jgi:hypothetical protein
MTFFSRQCLPLSWAEEPPPQGASSPTFLVCLSCTGFKDPSVGVSSTGTGVTALFSGAVFSFGSEAGGLEGIVWPWLEKHQFIVSIKLTCTSRQHRRE